MFDEAERLSLRTVHRKSKGRLFEDIIRMIYLDHLRPGDTFIDVGARLGLHTNPMARAVGENGRGLAVEADSAAAQELQRNLSAAGLKWVDVANVAVFSEPGQRPFYLHEKNKGWSSMYEGHAPPGPDVTQRVMVDVDTIDNLAKAHELEACHFVKVDIESAEIPALMGAKSILQKFRPLIVFENSPHQAAKLNSYTGHSFFQFFYSLQYQVFDISFTEFTPIRWQQDKNLLAYYVAAPRHAPWMDRYTNETFAARIRRAAENLSG